MHLFSTGTIHFAPFLPSLSTPITSQGSQEPIRTHPNTLLNSFRRHHHCLFSSPPSPRKHPPFRIHRWSTVHFRCRSRRRRRGCHPGSQLGIQCLPSWLDLRRLRPGAACHLGRDRYGDVQYLDIRRMIIALFLKNYPMISLISWTDL